MIIWILIVAGGLLISLAGLVLTFISRPPTLELARPVRQRPSGGEKS
jgi:hypothetical protein